MTSYEIVTGDCPQDVERKVKFMLSKGWLPLGGVTVTSNGAGPRTWAQAMILKALKTDRLKELRNEIQSRMLQSGERSLTCY